MLQNDKELKEAKKSLARIQNAIDLFSMSDFSSETMAQLALEAWKKEKARLEKQIQSYKEAK